LGFEYDGKGWHMNNKTDLIKNELCKSKNITLIRIIENNRKYESDIKSQLIQNLDIINDICKTNISDQYINNISSEHINTFICDNILDDNKIKQIVSKYTEYKDFRQNETKLYNKLINLKCLDKYTSHLKRTMINWSKNKAIKEIKKYNNLSDFIKKSPKCYHYLSKNNLLNLCEHLKTNNYFTILDIENEIKKYQYLKDFRVNSPYHYNYIKCYNLYNLIEHLKRSPKRQKESNIADIENEIKKFEYLIDFKNSNQKYFRFIEKHKLLYLTKDLKRKKPHFFISDIENEIKKYGSLKDFREKSLSCYKFIIRNKLNYLLDKLK
jgi:hypothetical protein